MAQTTPVLLEAQVEADREFRPLGDHAAPVASATRPDIKLSVHEDLAAIEHEWRVFEQRADGTVFQTYDWLSAWQRHIGVPRGVRPAVVIGRDARGEILLLLPLAVEPGGLARRLTFLGTELCDYNAPLLAPGFSLQVSGARFQRLWDDVRARLRSHPRLGFDLVNLERMPETLGAQHNPMLHIGGTPHRDRAYVLSLADSWDKLYARRSSATRRHDRSKRNKIAEHGAIRCIDPMEPAEIASTLETLMAQKSRWFAEMGVEDMFARPGHRAFFLDIATNPTTRALAHVSRLDVGSSTVAASFGLIRGDWYYHVLSSYDRGSPVARFGPGLAHLHDMLRFAIGRGFRHFDFSLGNERFKHEWCDIEMTLYDHVGMATLRGACSGLPIVVLREVKRWIRQNPALWTTFRRMRAALAAVKPR